MGDCIIQATELTIHLRDAATEQGHFGKSFNGLLKQLQRLFNMPGAVSQHPHQVQGKPIARLLLKNLI